MQSTSGPGFKSVASTPSFATSPKPASDQVMLNGATTDNKAIPEEALVLPDSEASSSISMNLADTSSVLNPTSPGDSNKIPSCTRPIPHDAQSLSDSIGIAKTSSGRPHGSLVVLRKAVQLECPLLGQQDAFAEYEAVGACESAADEFADCVNEVARQLVSLTERHHVAHVEFGDPNKAPAAELTESTYYAAYESLFTDLADRSKKAELCRSQSLVSPAVAASFEEVIKRLNNCSLNLEKMLSDVKSAIEDKDAAGRRWVEANSHFQNVLKQRRQYYRLVKDLERAINERVREQGLEDSGTERVTS